MNIDEEFEYYKRKMIVSTLLRYAKNRIKEQTNDCVSLPLTNERLTLIALKEVERLIELGSDEVIYSNYEIAHNYLTK